MSPFPEDLIPCPHCDLLEIIPLLTAGQKARCPRCGAVVARAKADSLNRTLALTVAAAIAFVVANIFPIMGLSAAGRTSMTALLAKLIALAFLLITVQRGSARNNRDRARLCRLLEIVGRWSMLDIFVATFPVALIQLRPLMSVTDQRFSTEAPNPWWQNRAMGRLSDEVAFTTRALETGPT